MKAKLKLGCYTTRARFQVRLRILLNIRYHTHVTVAQGVCWCKTVFVLVYKVCFYISGQENKNKRSKFK